MRFEQPNRKNFTEQVECERQRLQKKRRRASARRGRGRDLRKTPVWYTLTNSEDLEGETTSE